MTWDCVVTKYHKKYTGQLEIQPFPEVYMKSIVLKKTLNFVCLKQRQGFY
ncbi:reverse transcriptase [Vairimorpha ceranae]|uniref:Reverse transcriptase n=1 Tax=Vairimorpha ceranae TaxID=40302 RepID=A0A0F9W8E8_9MICR|nr:reverse transcriptase [Vairimorpha ceranae]KKO73996.1 reverse transcriptase [Vairimorpha ceranae]